MSSSSKPDEHKTISLSVNDLILYTGTDSALKALNDKQAHNIEQNSTPSMEQNFETLKNVSYDTLGYETLSTVNHPADVSNLQMKILGSSFSDKNVHTTEYDLSECDIASLMTINKDIILVCSNTDSTSQYDNLEAQEQKYVHIKPKPQIAEQEINLMTNEDSQYEYEAFWTCLVCSLDCPSHAILKDHLMSHTVAELSDSIVSSTEPMYKKKVLFINEHIINSEETDEKIMQIPIGNSMSTDDLDIKPSIQPTRPHKNSRKRGPPKKDGLGSRDPHTCSLCNKVLSSRGNLSKHMIIHRTDKPFVCQICDAKFNAKRDKELHHIQHHTNQRKSVCGLCGKGFSSDRILMEHYNSHNKTKSFPCRICDKPFQTAKSLKQHIKRHNSTKTYHCDICFKTFKVNYDMKNHLRKVHSIKPNKTSPIIHKSLNDSSLANSDDLLNVEALLSKESDNSTQDSDLVQEIEESVADLMEAKLSPESLMSSGDGSFLLESSGASPNKDLMCFSSQSVAELIKTSVGSGISYEMSNEDSKDQTTTYVIVGIKQEDMDSSQESTSPEKPVPKHLKRLPSIIRRSCTP